MRGPLQGVDLSGADGAVGAFATLLAAVVAACGAILRTAIIGNRDLRRDLDRLRVELERHQRRIAQLEDALHDAGIPLPHPLPQPHD